MSKRRWSPGVRGLLTAHLEQHDLEETATLLGVDRTSVTNWRTGKHVPSADTQALIKERCAPGGKKTTTPLKINDLKAAAGKLKTKPTELPQWIRVERVGALATPGATSNDEVTRAVSAIVQQVLREQNIGAHVLPGLIRTLRLAFTS